MFKNVSMTGAGFIAMLLVYGLQWVGIVVPQDEVAQMVVKAIEVITWIVTILGQLSRKDLSFGVFRRR